MKHEKRDKIRAGLSGKCFIRKMFIVVKDNNRPQYGQVLGKFKE